MEQRCRDESRLQSMQQLLQECLLATRRVCPRPEPLSDLTLTHQALSLRVYIQICSSQRSVGHSTPSSCQAEAPQLRWSDHWHSKHTTRLLCPSLPLPSLSFLPAFHHSSPIQKPFFVDLFLSSFIYFSLDTFLSLFFFLSFSLSSSHVPFSL